MEKKNLTAELEEMYVIGKFNGEIIFNAIKTIYALQDENAEQKAEIERLEKDVHDMSWIIKMHKYCVGADHCQNSSMKEFKLQKQVDELKFDKDILQKLIDKREKDTAKEILCELLDIEVKDEDYKMFFLDVCEKLEKFSQKYGVEVE